MSRGNATTTGFRATIEDVGLLELIQSLTFQLATGRLTVENLIGGTGELYLLDGTFVHSSVAGLTGQAALLELLGWSGGMCRFERDLHAPATTFRGMPSHGVLLEAMRILDERRRAMALAPAGVTSTLESSQVASEEDRAAQFVDAFARVPAVNHVGVLDHALNCVAASDASFAQDRDLFAMLIQTGIDMANIQSTDIPDVVEACEDTHNLLVVRMLNEFLCCRVNCAMRSNELIAEVHRTWVAARE